VISPPVKRKVCLNSFTQAALSRGWWASIHCAKPPWLSRNCWMTRALWMAASTLSRLRMMPASASSRATSSSPYAATRSTSKPS
jgi:hypothetical protein